MEQEFNTKLTPEEQSVFNEQMILASSAAGRNMHLDMIDYDMAGAFKEGLLKDYAGGYLPDKFKKPNHPTFSIDSIYNDEKAGRKGGRWEFSDEHNRWKFYASSFNIQQFGRKNLVQYFRENDPDVDLMYSDLSDMDIANLVIQEWEDKDGRPE